MATTVPMIAPDGTSGEIPTDRVQAATAAGFKQAVEMTSPDGKQGYIPVERQQDALKAGFKMATAPPDNRNWLQRSADWVQNQTDKLTTVTPEQEKAPSWMPAPIASAVNQVQKFGAGAIQGATQPLVHPLDTLSAIGNTIAHPIDTGKQMIQGAIAHPAQFAGNLVGGAVAGEAAAPIADAAGQLVAKPAGRTLLLGKTPEGAYESALKPSTTLSQADRAGIVQTGLENAIPVSKGGLQTIGNRIDELNQAIKDEIAADPTRQISTVPALNNLQSVRARFGNQVTPQPDLAEINQVQSNFLNHPKLQPLGAGPGPGSLNAEDAQAMKQGTYQALGDKAYGELKGASIEAQKSLARGLKDEIANQFPEIDKLNAAESKLLDLQPVLERAIGRIGNHQFIGIGTPIFGTMAKAISGSSGLGTVAAVMKAVLDDPWVKSRLAISLSKGAKIPFSQAAARVGAYSSALEPNASSAPGSPGGQTPNE